MKAKTKNTFEGIEEIEIDLLKLAVGYIEMGKLEKETEEEMHVYDTLFKNKGIK